MHSSCGTRVLRTLPTHMRQTPKDALGCCAPARGGPRRRGRARPHLDVHMRVACAHGPPDADAHARWCIREESRRPVFVCGYSPTGVSTSLFETAKRAERDLPLRTAPAGTGSTTRKKRGRFQSSKHRRSRYRYRRIPLGARLEGARKKRNAGRRPLTLQLDGLASL